MGNTPCQTQNELTNITSEFDLKKLSNNHNRKLKQYSFTSQKKNQLIGRKISSKQFTFTQNHSEQGKQKKQTAIQQKTISNQSTFPTEFSRDSPKKYQEITINQIGYKEKHFHDYFFEAKRLPDNKDFEPVSVPFKVIYLLLGKKFVSLIDKNHPKFFKKYQNDTDSFKLFKNGCYGHILSQNYAIFINSTYFYEGNFIKNESGNFQPSLKGTFITEAGKYIGQFKEGKPNGQGKYYEFTKLQDTQKNNTDNFQINPKSQVSFESSTQKFIKQKTYEGEWKNGQLINGKIQGFEFSYQGSIKNGKPHGEGRMYFKKPKITYQGLFKDGIFDGKSGIYQTPIYIYHGDFRNGKKQGAGILVKKTVVTKSSSPRIKYFGEERHEGIWRDDRLISEQYLGDIEM